MLTLRAPFVACVYCILTFVSFRLLSKTNPDRLPQLCALIVAGAREGSLGGEALLALAEALTWVGRPLPVKVRCLRTYA